jgi:hypothetical protein
MTENKIVILPAEALQIKGLIKSLAIDCIQLISETEKRDFSSFGVFTDSDMTVFDFFYNIKSDTVSDDPLTDKWWIPEWIQQPDFDESSANYTNLNTLYTIMSGIYKQTEWASEDDNSTFAIYKEEMFDLFCAVLYELKAETAFPNTTDDFFVLVQESDNGMYGMRNDSPITYKRANERVRNILRILVSLIFYYISKIFVV